MFSKLQILNLFIDPSTRQQHQPFRGYRRAKLHIWDRNHTLYPGHLSCSTPPWKGPSPFQRAILRDMFSPGFSTRSHSMRFGWSARRRHGKHVNTSRTQDYFCFYQNTAAAPAWRHPALPPPLKFRRKSSPVSGFSRRRLLRSWSRGRAKNNSFEEVVTSLQSSCVVYAHGKMLKKDIIVIGNGVVEQFTLNEGNWGRLLKVMGSVYRYEIQPCFDVETAEPVRPVYTFLLRANMYWISWNGSRNGWENNEYMTF